MNKVLGMILVAVSYTHLAHAFRLRALADAGGQLRRQPAVVGGLAGKLCLFASHEEHNAGNERHRAKDRR